MNRRQLFSAGATVSLGLVVGISTPAAAFTSYEEALREFEALRAMEVRLNGGRFDDAEWDVWQRRHDRFLDAAEALPNTPENARIKALAFKAIYRDDMDDFLDQDATTDRRLALQIIQSMLAAH